MAIDLAPAPWQLAPKDMVHAWQRAMEHLLPAQVFTQITLYDHGAVSFQDNIHKLLRITS